MRINLPCSKKKRYLTGNDWIINAFHFMTSRLTGVGNHSQIVLHLEGVPDESELRSRLDRFLDHFQVLRGLPARDLNLAPYWRPKRGAASSRGADFERIHFGDPPPAEEIHAVLERSANTPFRSKWDHLAFRLVTVANRESWLVMVFDHRLLDGRGAEMLLDLFRRCCENPEERLSESLTAPTNPACLNDWNSKFLSSRTSHRHILSLSRTDMATLPLPRDLRGCPYRFKTLFFDEGDSGRIVEAAYREAGYLMLLPHLLAATARAVHALFAERGIRKETYVIGLSLDARGPVADEEKLFFNHVSFLFFRVSLREIDDHAAMVKTLSEQMYSQVKEKIPHHINEATLLMRIFPLSLFSRFMKAQWGGKMGSYGFSYVGKTDFTSREFMGRPIRNLFHMPRVTAPPGLGVFFNQYRDRLNATFSYLDGMIGEDQACDVMGRLEEMLIGDFRGSANRGSSL
jgi:hypothetical protein